MTTAPDTPDNYCYRHPGRQSFVLCQRCGRTVCPDCQVQAAVGVHCVECAAQDRREAPRVRRGRPAFLRNLTGSGAPVVTYVLIAVCVVVFLLQQIPAIDNALYFADVFVTPGSGYPFEPWRMITSVFAHSSPLHLLLNMYTLFIFGSGLERLLGRWRFLALFLISGLGGSVAVLLLAPLTGVVGASGAIFGLMGAYFIINRHLGGSSVQLLILVAINLAYGFFVPGISWQAHVGGLIAGGVAALIFVRTRPIRMRNVQILLLAALVVALIAISVVKTLV